MSRTLRSTSTALALTLLLAGAAQAQPLRDRTGPAVLDLFRGWISSLWTPPGGAVLSSAWEEEGGVMDPDGRPAPSSQGEGADAGGVMDPDG